MKKIISLILMTIMLAAAVSSCVGGGTTTEPLQTTSTTEATTTFVTNAVYNGMTPSNETPADIKGEPVVVFKTYLWDMWYVREQHIRGSAAKQLEEIFEKAQKTGKTEEKYSDFKFPDNDDEWENIPYNVMAQYGVPKDTVWIEVGGKIYRRLPQSKNKTTEFCLVESHLGAGEVVSISEEDLEIYNAIRNYWPNNYYGGTYKDGTLELGHLYAAESRIDLKVLGCAEASAEKWSLFLEVSSKEGGEFVIGSESELSSDNLLRHYSVKVNLLPGETKIVELPFAVHKHWHSWTRVEADNTVISIHIAR